MNSDLLFIDFESFYAPEEGYGLKEMSIVEYVRSPRFKIFGFAAAFGEGPILWYSGFGALNFMRNIPWHKTTVVGHNVKFDGFILTDSYTRYPRTWVDTKGMSRAVLGKTIKSHSLGALATHFGLPSKGVMKTAGLETLTQEQEDELAEYCKHDVWLCREVYKKLAPSFPESEYKYMNRTIEMFVNPRLQLNVPLLEKASKEEAERRENVFKTIGIPKSEFASNKKFPELLKARGYDCPFKPSSKKVGEDGKPLLIPALALGDTAFLEMLESDNDELKMLCEARVAAKSTLLETRSSKLAKIGATGLWPFDVEYSGADQTHRFSGGSGAGGNPQNFTRDSALREAVGVRNLQQLVVGDFSQVEFRIVAALSKDPALLGLIAKNAVDPKFDFYCDYASEYYGRTITKKDDLERRFGKEAQLGLSYGMAGKKFKTRVKIKVGINISDDESWRAVNLYRTKHAGVPRLWEDLSQFIPMMVHKDTRISPPGIPVVFVHEGFLLPSGLKVRFPSLRQETGERGKLEWVYDVWVKGRLEKRRLYGGKLLENVSQSIAGELCKIAMDKMDDFVVGQVHDELHLVVDASDAEIAAERLREVMSESPSWMPELTLAAEVGIGSNWRMAK